MGYSSLIHSPLFPCLLNLNGDGRADLAVLERYAGPRALVAAGEPVGTLMLTTEWSEPPATYSSTRQAGTPAEEGIEQAQHSKNTVSPSP